MEYTDIDAWLAEQKEFLAKIGQVEEAKTTKTKKDEE
jgi:hypothetical protein